MATIKLAKADDGWRFIRHNTNYLQLKKVSSRSVVKQGKHITDMYASVWLDRILAIGKTKISMGHIKREIEYAEGDHVIAVGTDKSIMLDDILRAGDSVDKPTVRVLPDAVNHPPHYTQHPSGVECITITEHMGFNLGNAMKYVWRADLKNDTIEDMKKAVWYINREIQKREKQQTAERGVQGRG